MTGIRLRFPAVWLRSFPGSMLIWGLTVIALVVILGKVLETELGYYRVMDTMHSAGSTLGWY